MHSGLYEQYIKSLRLTPSGFDFLFCRQPCACWQQTPPEPVLIRWIIDVVSIIWYLYPRPTKLEGDYILDSPCPSLRLSVCPSVCRRHGFRSISQVSFRISISNFICMLMVAIGRSLLIFSDVTFKMAAWRPYWIFWFLDSNFTLALNINFKLQLHNTYVYG